MPNGEEVWQGNLQVNYACNGDDTRIGDSWIGCISYDDSPYFQLNDPLITHYWVIGANDDPSFDQCKSGPPNLSHQIYNYNSQDRGIFMMGSRDVVTDPFLPPKKVIKMGVHNSDHDFYCLINQDYELGTIPFLSFGAQENRGNMAAVGALATKNTGGLSRLQFKAQVIDYEQFSCPSNEFSDCTNDFPVGVHAGLFVIVEWNDTNHMLFFELIRTGVHSQHTRPETGLWNWPIEDSFYYPGAKLALFSADDTLTTACGFSYDGFDLGATEPQSFDINLSQLYECARDYGYYPDLPDSGVEIQGVHWFIETNGPKGEFSIELQDIEMLPDDLIFRDPFDS